MFVTVAASATAAGQPVAYLDLAGTFAPDYAAHCGLSLDQTVVIRPASLAGACGESISSS